MKPEFSGQILEKEINIKFHENPTSGSRVVSCGQKWQTDRHDEANSTFRNFAKCLIIRFVMEQPFTPNCISNKLWKRNGAKWGNGLVHKNV